MTDLVTVLTRWPLGSSRSRQTNRTLNSITTSRTLRTFFSLEAPRIIYFCSNLNIWGQRTDYIKKKIFSAWNKYLQVHLSLQQDQGDLVDQVYQRVQLHRLAQRNPSHQETPLRMRQLMPQWIKRNGWKLLFHSRKSSCCLSAHTVNLTCTEQQALPLRLLKTKVSSSANGSTHTHHYTNKKPLKGKCGEKEKRNKQQPGIFWF